MSQGILIVQVRALFEIRNIPHNMITKSERPVLPLSFHKFVVAEIQNIAYHGIEKTYSLLKDRFYWPNMFGHVTMFVSSCQICGKVKVQIKCFLSYY